MEGEALRRWGVEGEGEVLDACDWGVGALLAAEGALVGGGDEGVGLAARDDSRRGIAVRVRGAKKRLLNPIIIFVVVVAAAVIVAVSLEEKRRSADPFAVPLEACGGVKGHERVPQTRARVALRRGALAAAVLGTTVRNALVLGLRAGAKSGVDIGAHEGCAIEGEVGGVGVLLQPKRSGPHGGGLRRS